MGVMNVNTGTFKNKQYSLVLKVNLNYSPTVNF